MIEHAVNQYNQRQIINSLDKIVKIGDKFLQVRIIQTEKWSNRDELTEPMPRAKFVNPEELKGVHYFVDRDYLISLKKLGRRSRRTGS